MSIKTGVTLGKQLASALRETSETATVVSRGRMAIMTENEKVITVTVESGSQEDEQLKWLHGNVLKTPEGKIEFNADKSPKLVQNLLLAEVARNNGEKTSVTRYYEPNMEMVQSLGAVFKLPYDKLHDLARGMTKGKAGEIINIGQGKGGHW